MQPQQRVVRHPYVAPKGEALRVERGDSLLCHHRDEANPAWWWCTDRYGRSGWVHQSWFEEEDYRLIALEDIDARELSVASGERVQVLQVCDGRVLCQNAAGQVGWLPVAVLSEIG
ncbi:MAG: SH3 domain-containing protein [Anaerolineae bacterium]|nr:SH3 domain-containing protein [Thermoflexales bacterium]MDW8396343.1 SH3 domain-containing protein [Anaerolineae bacterium]